MPHPAGIRALSRPLAFSNNIILPKSSRTSVNSAKQETAKQSDCSERRPPRGTMDIFNSKEKHKSLSVPGRVASPSAKTKNSPKSSANVGPAKPATLAVEMESPPLIFHGSTSQSSGALLSGQLLLAVTDPDVTIASFTMTLQARVTTRKPVSKDCPDCATKSTELFTWTFLTEPSHFHYGTHTFPFSYLLPGHLPATSHGELGIIDYVLSARAIPTIAQTITVKRVLTVQRAVMPGVDKSSVRIFPPTNITATLALPSVIHPIGSFPVQMRLAGVLDTSIKNVQRRWRIRKVNWRIDEHSKIVSAACPRHAHKVGGRGKGVLHEDTRTIGGDELKSGWKTDFDTAGGQIELEFSAAIRANSHCVCDVESPTGLSATHNLVLEIIVAEEQTAAKAGKYATPTGAARVLRMQFKLVLTERAGLGISWDEEMPPMYEDVPDSPPGYTKMDDYEGDLPHDEELERMEREHGRDLPGS